MSLHCDIFQLLTRLVIKNHKVGRRYWLAPKFNKKHYYRTNAYKFEESSIKTQWKDRYDDIWL